jgi:hypothetical protein
MKPYRNPPPPLEIEHFFSIYEELEKKTGVEGWEDRGSAIKIIRESLERYRSVKLLGAAERRRER